MNPDRFARVKEILLAISDLPAGARSAYLDRECSGDPELRAEVDSVLPHEGLPTAMLGAEAATPGRTPETTGKIDRIGQTLSHYRILGKVGAGGMGEVYLAHDDRLERDVTLKILLRGTLADDAERKRFRREALALSKLNHPNIATVFDFDTQEGVDFLVMEYVAGETLHERLRGGPLPEREIARLGLQLAEGLAAAHVEGIVHRDLKPGNVRLTTDGRLKILDFGLAKRVRSSTEATATETVTAIQGLAGTIPYMAPEQLRGEAVDARTDIWAAGAVLYEIATGRRAFPEVETGRLITAILTEPSPLPSAVHRRVSSSLESIIVKCLEKDPELRYQSAKELAVDLRRLETPSAVVTSGGRAQAARAGRPVAGVRGLRTSIRAAAMAAAGAAVLLVAAILAFNLGGLRERLFAGTTRIGSLAVLPLRNLSGDPQQEYFADGMTDAIVNDLCKVAALRVISTTSVMQYKNTNKSLAAIARELGVDAVVEGSVLRLGDQVRINAQLIRAGKERQIWAESYERGLSDVLRLQNEIAQSITGAVRATLTPEDQTRLTSARVVDPAAYEAYLLGQHYRNDWAGRHDFEKSRDQFLRAIQLDPQFAGAYAGLAVCYTELSLWSLLPPREALPLALDAANKAVQIDSMLAESHDALGMVRLQLLWDWPGAERAFQRALALNPKSYSARMNYRFFLSCSDRKDQAVALAEELLRDTPNSDTARGQFAWTLFYARRYDSAIAEQQRILAGRPEFGDMRVFLAYSYACKGMSAQALAECDHLMNRPESFDPIWIGTIGWVYLISGRRDKGPEFLERLHRQEQHGYVDPFFYATIYAGMADKDQAFACLSKAVEIRSTNVLQLSIEPAFDGLRSDPRFGQLLRIIGPPGAKP